MKRAAAHWLLLFGLTLAAGEMSCGATPPAELQSLSAEIAQWVDRTRGEPANSPARASANELQSLVWQIGDQWKEGNWDSVEHGLRSMIEHSPSGKAAEQARTLLAQATKEKDQRNTAFLAKMDEAMRDAVETCRVAKTSTELDAILAKFQTLTANLPRARDPRIQRAVEQTRSAARFLRKWQDYLSQTETGNHKAATQVLDQLSDDATASLIVPRSELLRRHEAAQAAQTTASRDRGTARLAAGMHSLEDLTRVLDSANTSWDSDDDGSMHRFFVVLKHLQMGWFELKSGNASKAIEVANNTFDHVQGVYSNEVLEAFSRIQRDLLLRALPIELGLPQDRGPKKEESANDYLMRLMTEAHRAQDWFLMARVLEAFSKNAGGGRRNSPDWLNTEKQALNHYIVAQNQEKAGEIEAAVRSYESALRLPSHYLPVGSIGEKVGALKQRIRDSQLPPVEK